MTDKQTELQKRVNIQSGIITASQLKTIAGVDISFFPTPANRAVVALTVYKYADFLKPGKAIIKPLYNSTELVELKLDYIPGYLAFREVPHYQQVLQKLKKDRPDLYPPSLVMVDGNGVYHPRGLGAASHLGVEENIPTIGVGKTFYQLDGLEEDVLTEEFINKCINKGDTIPIIGQSQTCYGYLFKSTPHPGGKHGIYISPGHLVTLQATKEIVTATCLFKNPEPVRMADLLGRDVIRNYIRTPP